MSKQNDNALFLFDYMLSKMHAIYESSESTYKSVDHFYLFEKLDFMSRFLKEEFDNDFSKFVESLKSKDNYDYELTS